jgi:hypothetical protein
MPPNRTVIAVVAGAAVVAAAVALPLFQPWRLFTDTVVDEALPGAPPATVSTAGPATPVTASPSVMASSSPAPPTISGDRPSTPAQAPVTLGQGRLISHEHDTSGSVAILRLPNGSRTLRIEGLDTSDGPDLKVWLSDAPVREGKAGWHVFDDGKYHSLGKLKGNKGSQNYPIPADVDLSAFSSVTIWCDRFNVSFGAAELKT